MNARLLIFIVIVCQNLAEKRQDLNVQINKTNSQMSEEQINQDPKLDAQNLIGEKPEAQREINREDKVDEQNSKIPGKIAGPINQQEEKANQKQPEKQQIAVEAQTNKPKPAHTQQSHPEQQEVNPSITQQKQENIELPPIDSMHQNTLPSIMQSRKTIQSKICQQNTVSNLAEPKVEAQQQNIGSFQQTYSLNQKILIEHPKQETKEIEQPTKVEEQHLSKESSEKQKYRLESEVVQSVQEEREKKVVQFVEFNIQESHKIVENQNTIKQGQSVSVQTQNKELNFSFSDKGQAKVAEIHEKSNNLSLQNLTIKIDNPRKDIGRIAKKPLHQKKIHDAIVLLQRNDPKKIVIPRLEESPKKQDSKEIDLSKLDTHITLNSNIMNITIGELMSKQSGQAGILLQQIQQLKQRLFEMEYSKRRQVINDEEYYSPSQRDQYRSPSECNYESIEQENALSNKHNNRQSLGKFYQKIENNHSKLSEQLRRAGLATERKGNITINPDSSKSKPRFSSAEAFQKSDSQERDRNIQSKGPILFRVKRNNKNLGGKNIDNEEKERQVGFIKNKEKSDQKDKCFQAKRDNPKLQFTEQEIMNIIEKPVQRSLIFEEDFRQYIERFFLDIGEQIPKRNWSQQQLVNLAKLTFKKFGVNIEMEKDLTLHIKKYKNCVQFVFDSTKTILWYYDGKFYYGGWIVGKQGEGEKSGWGYNFSPGKFVYSGNFKDNKREGYGIMKFLSRENDTIYEGFWQNGFKNGLGKQNEADGSIYYGQWKDGKKHGKGKCVVSPAQKYEGDYSNGLKHGFGHQTFKNGDSYVGNYFEGKFHGSGVYTWANHSKYEGEFRDGSRNGNGRWISDYRDAKSDQYEGQYSNDKKSGFGLYKWKDGTVYQGQFLNDLKHGEGVVSYGDGKSTRLEWFEGNIVSQQTPVDKIKPRDRNTTSKQSSQRSGQSKNSGSKPPVVKFNIKSTSKSKPNRSSARIQQI